MSKLEHVKNLSIYRNDEYYCGPGPTACIVDGGTILVAFRRCTSWTKYGYWDHYHPNTEACITRSSDGGSTWSDPEVFWRGGVTNQNFRVIADGSIVATMFDNTWIPEVVWEQVKDRRGVYKRTMCSVMAGAFTIRSEDSGRTWQGPYWVKEVPGLEPVFEGGNAPLAIRGPIEELADGTLLYPLYVGVAANGDPEIAYAVASSDSGRTWEYRGTVAADPALEIGYNELTFHQCPSGKIVAFIRSAKADGWLYTSFSDDNGYTWSEPLREACWGHPFTAASLLGGNVVLCYGYRREPFGIRARLLNPECTDIGESEEIVLREDGAKGDLGYPDLTVLPDGSVLIIYYMNSRDDDGQTRYIAADVVKEVST